MLYNKATYLECLHLIIKKIDEKDILLLIDVLNVQRCKIIQLLTNNNTLLELVLK